MPLVEQYDAVVIGAGQSGGPLATALAEAGRKTVLIEREHVGGTCVNEGCTPTKTMVASARVAYLARRAADYGVETGPVTVDMARVRARKRAMVDSFRTGGERRLAETEGLTFHCGEASFTGPKQIVVRLAGGGSVHLSGETIVLNCGARPALPQLPGIDAVPTLNSTSIMELDEVPEHLLILGGGSVGVEFAQMFRRFGSRVTVVQRGPRLLGREDADVAAAVHELLVEDGIDVLLDTSALHVAQANGTVDLTVQTPPAERTLTGSHLLLAAGRTPNTDRLNLAAAGVETDRRGYIEVNERLETSATGVYALGDVNGGPALTHISYDDFRIMRTNLLGSGGATTCDRLVPYTVFTDPQLGRVGLTEEEARGQGRAIQVVTMPMSSVARALEFDEPRGFMKVIVDAGTQQILGAAILGLEGGELMAMLQIAMMGGLPYTALRDAIFAHPTLAESFNNLFA